MASKQIKISDVFEQSCCGVCGYEDINQYFSVNENFVEYLGVYVSLREILRDSLDIKVDVKDGKAMEICLDCKDKVVKFYHFKRKAQEVQKKKNMKPPRVKNRSKPKTSKVVQNIVQIVENYAEKCSVAQISVDQSARKLVIEPKKLQISNQQDNSIKQMTQDDETANDNNDNDDLLNEMYVEAPTFDASDVNIKEEQVFGEPISYVDQNDMDDDQNDMDDDSYQDTDYSYNYGASTSKQQPSAKKRKTEPQSGSEDCALVEDEPYRIASGRRVSGYTDKDLNDALNEICNESARVYTTARKYKIPPRTLRSIIERSRLKLNKKDPKNQSQIFKRGYTIEDRNKALSEIRSGMPVRKASRIYNIPQRTLRTCIAREDARNIKKNEAVPEEKNNRSKLINRIKEYNLNLKDS